MVTNCRVPPDNFTSHINCNYTYTLRLYLLCISLSSFVSEQDLLMHQPGIAFIRASNFTLQVCECNTINWLYVHVAMYTKHWRSTYLYLSKDSMLWALTCIPSEATYDCVWVCSDYRCTGHTIRRCNTHSFNLSPYYVSLLRVPPMRRYKFALFDCQH